jgi:hypothetical protein
MKIAGGAGPDRLGDRRHSRCGAPLAAELLRMVGVPLELQDIWPL